MNDNIDNLLVPPTEIELADLNSAVQAEPGLHQILRRLIFQRDMLLDQIEGLRSIVNYYQGKTDDSGI